MTAELAEQPAPSGDPARVAADRIRSLTELAAGKRVPWESVRMAYVDGMINPATGKRWWPTLRQVARAFEVNDSYVRVRSSQEGWSAAREATKAQLTAEARARMAEELLQGRVVVDFGAFQIARTVREVVQGRLDEINHDAAVRAARKAAYEAAAAAGASPEVLDRIGFDMFAMPVDGREVASLAQAASTSHKMALLAVGENPALRIQLEGELDVVHSIDQDLSREDDADRILGLAKAIERATAGSMPKELEPMEILEAELVEDEVPQ